MTSASRSPNILRMPGRSVRETLMSGSWVMLDHSYRGAAVHVHRARDRIVAWFVGREGRRAGPVRAHREPESETSDHRAGPSPGLPDGAERHACRDAALHLG